MYIILNINYNANVYFSDENFYCDYQGLLCINNRTFMNLYIYYYYYYRYKCLNRTKIV